ncbi:Urease accessory protein UreF [Citrobacter werkmanii]|uniref:Urease accessory protein UreF n=1 Tax=Citrobacter werkmanii TaxID=67827 RepID=A0A9N8CR39_9ENTR|nr:Urease accessory protein UreF [Citrobacter werkmanii]CAB5573125.1 Urease accessory protein UreF [Citrobacter werkmanii]CAB5583859.1 Urease accessory protein UreF [Citrobacter werkmanii]CAB5593788.1 Urease accessory protein UreF [Citrobacter werkmanii]CAB5596146.1 Urease accessory protein UreF [Citrobacter werkmanii]
MHSTQQLRLMQLASSSLPVGSFTWSQGLEWAVEIGWVKSVDDFSDWQIQQMEHNFFTVDLPLLARLYRACEQDDLAAARRWTAYLRPVGKPANCGMKNAAGASPLRDWLPTGNQTVPGNGARSLPTASCAAWPGWAYAGKSP